MQKNKTLSAVGSLWSAKISGLHVPEDILGIQVQKLNKKYDSAKDKAIKCRKIKNFKLPEPILNVKNAIR